MEKADDSRMTAARLCVARTLSGAAGDGAQSLSGTITRLIGGANIGFVILGKFSFGDNETLAKFIDVLVENFTRRSTEIALEAALYGVNEDDLVQPIKSTLQIVKWFGDCQ